MRVNTRVAGMPPRSLIHAAVSAMCPASGASPASRSATYASTVVDRSASPPAKFDQVPSARRCDLIQRAAASVSSGVLIRRNSRSSRSSASMVTLVCSSPCHQPSSCCRLRRCATARSSVSLATSGTA